MFTFICIYMNIMIDSVMSKEVETQENHLIFLFFSLIVSLFT